MPPRTPAVRRVIETREKIYPFRPRATEFADPKTGKRKWLDDPGGIGRETVLEAILCAQCAGTP